MTNGDYWRLVAVGILADGDTRQTIRAAFGHPTPSEKDAQRTARALNIKIDVTPTKCSGVVSARLFCASVRRKGGGFVLGADSVLKAAYAALALEFARRDLSWADVAAMVEAKQRKAAA